MPTAKDAQLHVSKAAERIADAVSQLRLARDELVRALLDLGRLKERGEQRSVLLPLTLLAVVSSAFDTLAFLAPRLDSISKTTPAKVEGEWREVVAGIFGEER